MRFLVISGGVQVIDFHTVMLGNYLERGACGVRSTRGGLELKNLSNNV